MEVALPLLMLGAAYVISKRDNEPSPAPEPYTNMGNASEAGIGAPPLPNTNIPPKNYPTLSDKTNSPNAYPSTNSTVDKYLNQNAYEQRVQAGLPTTDVVQKRLEYRASDTTGVMKTSEASFQNVYSLTGQAIPSNQFVHNNMVPFNGTKPQGQIYNIAGNESVLDNMTGAASRYERKTENAALFKPQADTSFVNGMPPISDFLQSRVEPSARNHAVLPFQQERVAPGLGLGYTTQGANGFNSGTLDRDKWMPKNVDDLRIASNPKESFTVLGYEGPAMGPQQIGILGEVEKNRPDRFYIQSQDRWFTTTGAEKGPTLQPQEPDFVSQSRGTQEHLALGVAGSTLKTASYVPSAFDYPKRLESTQPLDVPPSTACGRGELCDLAHPSHTVPKTHRATVAQPDMVGSGFSRAIGAVVAPLLDVLRPTRKEELVENFKQSGIVTGVKVAANDFMMQGACSVTPKTTNKETTLYAPNGYVGNQSQSGLNTGYANTDVLMTPNNRNFTMTSYAGVAANPQMGVIDNSAAYAHAPDTMKETAIVGGGRTNTGVGAIFTGNMGTLANSHGTERENPRMFGEAPNIPIGPSIKTYGTYRQPQTYDQEKIGLDRINPTILQAFRENPYTQPLTSWA